MPESKSRILVVFVILAPTCYIRTRFVSVPLKINLPRQGVPKPLFHRWWKPEFLFPYPLTDPEAVIMSPPSMPNTFPFTGLTSVHQFCFLVWCYRRHLYFSQPGPKLVFMSPSQIKTYICLLTTGSGKRFYYSPRASKTILEGSPHCPRFTFKRANGKPFCTGSLRIRPPAGFTFLYTLEVPGVVRK